MTKQIKSLVLAARSAMSLAHAVRSTPEVPDTQAARAAALGALDGALIAAGWWADSTRSKFISPNRRDEIKFAMGHITVLSEELARYSHAVAFDAAERRNAL